VKRLSLDGAPGTEANNSWQGMHGTRMAFVGSAPINGWGAVGFWPGARIVSIRAMPRETTGFAFQTYADAVFMCATWRTSFNVVAINVSLACACEPSSSERSILADRITRAHANGISVVAAAGNDAGEIGSPADEEGVLAIGANDDRGDLCAFSARGAELALTAPGCSIDMANPVNGEPWTDYSGGTSAASMTASTVLALLRSYRPELDREHAEEFILSSNRADARGRALDVEAIFRAAGLGALVDAAKERAGQPVSGPTASAQQLPSDIVNAPTGDETPAPAGLPRARLRAPYVRRVSRRGRRLFVSTGMMPVASRLRWWLQVNRREFRYDTVAHARTASPTFSIVLPRSWRGGRLVLRYEVRAAPRLRSSARFRTLR
jgi:subtilisin family serine protease